MTNPDLRPPDPDRIRTEATVAGAGRGPEPAPADDPDDPWHGIPAALLDGLYSYDTDSAGGCG